VEGQPEAPYAAVFPARHDAFLHVRTFVEETCGRAQVTRADCLRLMLLVEELFVNTVRHGHGRDTDAPVRLALTVTPSAIAVAYEDTARAFDPFAAPETPIGGDDVDERPVGGLGIRLIMTMADDVGYVRDDGWNRITFRLARSG
jgi:anti-sigma regulatory factor (Ser/Thr protein kinase)